jgi:hypothetical protein
MDTSKLDAEINTADARLGQLRKEMSVARDVLVDAVSAFASDWYETRVRNAVEGDPARAKELGVEGLRALKTDLATLQKRRPGIVNTRFTQKISWPHESDEPVDPSASNPFMTHGAHLPKALEEPLRTVIGAVQPLISQHGLAQDENFTGANEERFPYHVDAPPAVKEAAAKFSAVYDAFREIARARADAEAAKAKAEARDLWDKA